MGHPRTQAEEALFRRLMAWSEDPMKDPLTAWALRGDWARSQEAEAQKAEGTPE